MTAAACSSHIFLRQLIQFPICALHCTPAEIPSLSALCHLPISTGCPKSLTILMFVCKKDTKQWCDVTTIRCNHCSGLRQNNNCNELCLKSFADKLHYLMGLGDPLPTRVTETLCRVNMTKNTLNYFHALLDTLNDDFKLIFTNFHVLCIPSVVLIQESITVI